MNLSVCGLVTGTSDRSPFVLTAGSDLRIRYWDLSAIERQSSMDPRERYPAVSKNCAIVAPAAREGKPEMEYE